jgi:probable F420-dependent oxidoreductase
MEIDCSLMGVPLAGVAERTRQLAALGAHGCYTAEGPNDVFFPLVLAAAAAPVAIMTNAAIAFPRNPVHLAHSAFDLAQLSAGRFRLGLAPQIRSHIERRFGIEWGSPADRMAELIGAVRAIFATWQDGVPLAVDGTFYRHSYMPPMFTPAPLPTGAPTIILGAQGPKMAAVAGATADGLSVLPFHSQRLLHDVTLPAASAARANSVRADEPFELVCGVILGLGTTATEVAAARRSVAALLGFYGSTPAYAEVITREGLTGLHEALRTAVRADHWSTLADLVPDALIDAVAVVDTPSRAARRLRERFGGLADRLSLFLPGATSDELLGELLGDLAAGGTLEA